MLKSSRILASAVALGGFLMMSASAIGAEFKPFTQAAFDAAKASGQSILVDVAAPWCPTCKAQEPIIDELAAQPKFKDLKVFKVDFDTQKDIVRQLRVPRQSTLIVYKGKTETGRSVAETDKAAISDLLDKSL